MDLVVIQYICLHHSNSLRPTYKRLPIRYNYGGLLILRIYGSPR